MEFNSLKDLRLHGLPEFQGWLMVCPFLLSSLSWLMARANIPHKATSLLLTKPCTRFALPVLRQGARPSRWRRILPLCFDFSARTPVGGAFAIFIGVQWVGANINICK
jgi:hypothetical protein